MEDILADTEFEFESVYDTPTQDKEIPEKEETPNDPEETEDTEETNEPEETEQPVKVKLDDVEYDLEQIKEFKDAYINKHKWSKNLTEKSATAANLTDEQLKYIVDVTNNFRNLDAIQVPPEYESAQKNIDLSDDAPFIVAIENEDGNTVQTDLKPYLRPFVSHYQTKLNELQDNLAQAQIENGFNLLVSQVAQIPDIHIADLSLEKLNQILVAGSNHPDYESLERIKLASQYSVDNQIPIKDAYNRLFAHKKVEEKNVERIKNNQKSPAPEPPGTTPVVDEVQKQVDDTFGGDSAADRLNQLFG